MCVEGEDMITPTSPPRREKELTREKRTLNPQRGGHRGRGVCVDIGRESPLPLPCSCRLLLVELSDRKSQRCLLVRRAEGQELIEHCLVVNGHHLHELG